MRQRWRVILIVSAVVVLVLAYALINGEQLRATVWTARAENCGSLSINLHALVTSTADAQRAEACYARAATACQPAVLVVNSLASDTNGTYTFLVEPPIGPAGACEIAAGADVSNASGDSYTVSSCQSVTQQSSALKFTACGDLGDVTLPAEHAGVATL